MAPVHGKDTKIFWGGYDLTTYGREVSSDGSADVAETSTFGKGSKTYVPGLKDATLSASGIYDAAAGASAQVLETVLAAADQVVCQLPEGDALDKLGRGILSVATQFQVSSPVDDVVSWAAEAQSSVGVEPIRSLHALTQETATGNGTAIDNTTSSSDGAAGYLVVTDVGGTNPTLDVKIQHSPDNAVWSDLITFAQVTADNRQERKKQAGTVNRYLRHVRTLGGTNPTATYFVAVSRQPGN